jgi:ribonuclease HII
VREYEFDFTIVNEDRAASPILPGLQTPSSSLTLLAGVDEAGRGPLAGPVVAAAVILPSNPRIFGLRDSKIVPPEQREALYCEIKETALATAVALIENDVIDSINIFAAAMQAMRQCVLELSPQPDLVLVDGNQKPRSGRPERAIVKGDGLSAAIMAASILAKVTRDHIMIRAHASYPQYGFDEHKGYACKRHIEAIRKYGPCPLHRLSFDPVRTFLRPQSLLLSPI